MTPRQLTESFEVRVFPAKHGHGTPIVCYIILHTSKENSIFHVSRTDSPGALATFQDKE